MRSIRYLLIISLFLLINIVIIKAALIGNMAISNDDNRPSNRAENAAVSANVAISGRAENAAVSANVAISGQELNQGLNSNTAISNEAVTNIEWVDPQENTLGLSEHFTRDNFIVEATDFYNSDSDPTVLITVYDAKYGMVDGGIVSKVIARPNDAWNFSDKENTSYMNITIKDLKMEKGNISASEGLNNIVDERVKIRTELAGQPIPILSILPVGKQINNRTFIDRVFNQGSEISINFSIYNNGKATLRNMHFILNRDKNNEKNLPFLFPDEQVDRELPDLQANDTVVINVRFKAPNVNSATDFNISATVIGKDFFGNEFSVTDHTFITVRYFYDKLIDIQKFVPEKIYMGDLAYIVLNIQNNGFSNITGIHLKEQIPEGFEILNDFPGDNFTLDLGPLEKKTITYGLKPIKPGIYDFPAKSSVIEWDGGLEYNNKSNKLIVNGPYVELKKYGSVEGDNIKINILAKNSGDMTAIVRLKDLVPNAGTILKSLVIRSNSMAIVSYTINMADVSDLISDGEITFPSADAEVLDQFLYTNDKYTQEAISNNLTIRLYS